MMWAQSKAFIAACNALSNSCLQCFEVFWALLAQDMIQDLPWTDTYVEDIVDPDIPAALEPYSCRVELCDYCRLYFCSCYESLLYHALQERILFLSDE